MCDHVAGKIMPLRPNVAVWCPRPYRFDTGPWESKAFSNRHSSDMVSALHGVQEAKCSGTASNSTPNSEQTQLDFTQVMRALEMSYLDTPDYYPPPSSYPQFKDQAPSEDDVIVVPV